MAILLHKCDGYSCRQLATSELEAGKHSLTQQEQLGVATFSRPLCSGTQRIMLPHPVTWWWIRLCFATLLLWSSIITLFSFLYRRQHFLRATATWYLATHEILVHSTPVREGEKIKKRSPPCSKHLHTKQTYSSRVVHWVPGLENWVVNSLSQLANSSPALSILKSTMYNHGSNFTN